MNLSRIFWIFFVGGSLGSCWGRPNPIAQRKEGITHLTDYLNSRSWDSLFPNRYGRSHTGPDSAAPGRPDFYSFQAFVTAAKKFPEFLGTGNDTLRRRELAAFLAHCAQETSGGWPGAPGGYFKWGFYFIQEQGCSSGCPQYSDRSNKAYPPVPGQSYHGRGPKQLSYNYNYGQFSQDYFGDKYILLR
ncbi:MAG TPA: chitinase, partial [Chitinophagaceae bacterium]|nr:chitinase [Chitinophagaceae bacterium]